MISGEVQRCLAHMSIPRWIPVNSRPAEGFDEVDAVYLPPSSMGGSRLSSTGGPCLADGRDKRARFPGRSIGLVAKFEDEN